MSSSDTLYNCSITYDDAGWFVEMLEAANAPAVMHSDNSIELMESDSASAKVSKNDVFEWLFEGCIEDLKKEGLNLSTQHDLIKTFETGCSEIDSVVQLLEGSYFSSSLLGAPSPKWATPPP